MRIFLSIIIGIFITGLGIFFLYNGKLNGTESVVLILGGVLIGFVVYFSSEIQEFSIAGNAVKLKELRGEALKTIDELKQARADTFRLMLVQVLKLSGGWGNGSKVEERVKDFLNTYDVIVKFECVEALSDDLKNALSVLITSQYNKLHFIHESEKKSEQYCLDDLWKPQDLYIKLKDEMVQDIIDRYQSGGPKFEDIKRDIYLALEAYKELYLIYKKLQS
ncbi:hypothetical protein [Acinetobacter sp. 3657]|uniref:hypothetical protein n=1 Tax=Acinetobacter sp. 3657 TaxID=2817764 RepID=UPI0028562529|nr:hypothetical protein [Prolinoborus sp. 3657]